MPPALDNPIRHAVGVMTGTSIDGLDAALVRLEGHGYELQAELLGFKSVSLGKLAAPLRAAANQQPMTAGDFARLALEFGRLHAEVIVHLAGSGPRLDLIAVHGQTVFHDPPVSWQLINPAPIEHAFGCPVISDLRQADLASRGQGAPITPLADWVMFRDETRSRAIVNLGGFINLTFLPRRHRESDPDLRHDVPQVRRGAPLPQDSGPRIRDLVSTIQGRDLCAGNQLLDAIARKAFDCAYDDEGRHARSGIIRDELIVSLMEKLRAQGDARRSLGTGDELEAWVCDHLHNVPPADLAASACTALSRCVTESIERFGSEHDPVDEIILAGGGTRNRALVDALRHHALQPVRISDDLGVPAHGREAMAMAILGAMKLDGIPITLPQVTGRAVDEPGSSESRFLEESIDHVIP